MSTGQTMLTLGAFMFLSTILLNFYRLVSDTGTVIASGQDGILATTIATSYMELAQGMAFDNVTDTSDIAIANPSALTTTLGPEAGEDSLWAYNDFDDFNGATIDKQAVGSNRRYRTTFSVRYVNPDDVGQISGGKTFVKRMDLKTWRIFPPATGPNDIDTVQTSLVMGYFHFD
jgi:hypothetical protein